MLTVGVTQKNRQTLRGLPVFYFPGNGDLCLVVSKIAEGAVLKQPHGEQTGTALIGLAGGRAVLLIVEGEPVAVLLPAGDP